MVDECVGEKHFGKMSLSFSRVEEDKWALEMSMESKKKKKTVAIGVYYLLNNGDFA